MHFMGIRGKENFVLLSHEFRHPSKNPYSLFLVLLFVQRSVLCFVSHLLLKMALQSH